mmetsp:Transcript_16919/g.50519  ORF Transcript_16919/g.50519 Transcript_16919/m.50519 type:complete len:357 (-) Transcript_16919:1142-2212(-)
MSLAGSMGRLVGASTMMDLDASSSRSDRTSLASASGRSNAAPLPSGWSCSMRMRPMVVMSRCSRLRRMLKTDPGLMMRAGLSVINRSVTWPSSCDRRERGLGTSVTPDRAARAAAMAPVGSELDITFSAAGRKNCTMPESTMSSRPTTALLALDMTSAGAGGPTISQLSTLHSLSTRLKYRSSRGVYMAMAVPDRPARPVRPDRCRNDSVSAGSSKCTTRSTAGMSNPRAATSVATSTRHLPSRNRCSVRSRLACEMSPCRTSVGMWLAIAADTSSASRLVCVNTMHLPPPPCTVSRSTSTDRFASICTHTASILIVSASLPVEASPMRSTIRGFFWYWRVRRLTQPGMVAENSSV